MAILGRRKASKRVVLNRSVAEAIPLAMADGMQEAGEAIIARAIVPDAPPYGRGLVRSGRVATYMEGKLVAGSGGQPRNSRAGRHTLVTYVGFGFPGRFLETGTVKMRARPFLTPAFAGYVGEIGNKAAGGIRERLRRLR